MLKTRYGRVSSNYYQVKYFASVAALYAMLYAIARHNPKRYLRLKIMRIKLYNSETLEGGVYQITPTRKPHHLVKM